MTKLLNTEVVALCGHFFCICGEKKQQHRTKGETITFALVTPFLHLFEPFHITLV